MTVWGFLVDKNKVIASIKKIFHRYEEQTGKDGFDVVQRDNVRVVVKTTEQTKSATWKTQDGQFLARNNEW